MSNIVQARPHGPATGAATATVAARALAMLTLVLLALTGPLASTSWASPGRIVTPEAFGAVGNGKSDDTSAIRAAINALRPGDTLAIAAGKVYRHTDVLTIRTPDVLIKGSGTLLATDESRSAVFVDADRVEIDDVTFRMASTTKRWGTWDQMKLRIGARTGIKLERVTVDGSAAAGIYLWGASNFLIEEARVHDTRADGIHITGPSHDGTVRHPVVDRSGDDGVGIVSYQMDQVPVKKVLVDRPVVRFNTWGRGVSVVGGEDITLRKVYVRASSAAGIYVASEGQPWNTFAPVRVTVQQAKLRATNTAAQVDHGAFLVYSGSAQYPPRDISAEDVTILQTRKGASSQVGVRADPGCTVQSVSLKTFSVEGGGNVFAANVPASSYVRSGWRIS